MATDNKNKKYAYLNRLSTEQLEELLRADIESPETSDVDVVFYILEVIEERENKHPGGHLHDEDEAWEEFQQYYNIPEGEGLSLYPTTDETDGPSEEMGISAVQDYHRRTCRSPAWRRVDIVAATVAVFFALLVGAQAVGIDVFGTLGRWTDETFHFVTSSGKTTHSGEDATSDPESIDYYNSIQAALNDIGITDELVPTWYPAGFEASEPKILSSKLSDAVHISFSDGNESFFNINITRYQSASNLATGTFEKDSTPVEQYTSGARTFYIMSNVDTLTAIWSEGLLVEKISGTLQIDEIKAVIDSIGG